MSAPCILPRVVRVIPSRAVDGCLETIPDALISRIPWDPRRERFPSLRESLSRSNRALRYTRHTIILLRSFLQKPMPMETSAFFRSSDGIGQFDCILQLVHQILSLISSNTRAFNPIAPISLDERCRELAIDEQPIFGVPICCRDFTSDSEIIVPRPAITRHRRRSLRAIRRITPRASSAWLGESQYVFLRSFRGLQATHTVVQALRQVSLGSAPIAPI